MPANFRYAEIFRRGRPRHGKPGLLSTYDAFYIPVGLSKEPSALEDKDVRGDVTDLYLEYQLYKSIDTKAAALTVEYTAAFDKYSKAYGSNID